MEALPAMARRLGEPNGGYETARVAEHLMRTGPGRGENGARVSRKHTKSMNKHWHALRPENPHGIPKDVMKALQQETLAGDQRPYDIRLQQLLTLRGLNRGG